MVGYNHKNTPAEYGIQILFYVTESYTDKNKEKGR